MCKLTLHKAYCCLVLSPGSQPAQRVALVNTKVWVEGKQRGSNQRSLFLLISPWTAVSTCHSYSSTLGKVERRRRDAFLSAKQRLPGRDACTDASVQRLCANWVEKMGRTGRAWWTVWGAWYSRKDRNIGGRKTCKLKPKTHTNGGRDKKSIKLS